MTVRFDDDLATLRETFAAATFSDGGLLLHLPSGDFFQLNANGAAVWAALADATTVEQAAALVGEARAISSVEARSLVERAVAQGRAVRVDAPAGKLRFDDTGTVISLRDDGRPLLSFDRRSLLLSAGTGVRDRADDDVAAALRVFVPKIFGGWYSLALHASTVDFRGRRILFSGDSGAGKTTTARVLADEIAGCRLLSEDVVVLSEHDGTAMMVEGAEAVVQDWMRDATEALVTRRDMTVEVRYFREALALRSRRLALHKIVFLDAACRGGPNWSLATLAPSAALRLIFVQSFIHSSDPTVLRAHLGACRMLANELAAARAVTIPSGLDELRTSSSAQIETIAS